ncbi:MAG: PH domain-containing protein [Victivallales bacterium]
MYQFVKNIVLRVLRVPPEPLDPMGDVGSLKVFRASPNFFKYRLYVWILQKIFSALVLALGTGIYFYSSLKTHPLSFSIIAFTLLTLAGICVVGVVHLIISFIMLRLDYEMRWYKITDRSLRIREGVVFVREMTLTFANIQNISISQGPIQRYFGIADLKVETAGGGAVAQPDHNAQSQLFSMHVGIFRGIDNHDEVRDTMLARLKKLRDSGLGDTDESNSAAPPAPGKKEEAAIDILQLLRQIGQEAAMLNKSAASLGGSIRKSG